MEDLLPMLGSAADRRERQPRADAAANRSRILQTAQTLFSRAGVAAVTMSEIAEAAGVGKGTLYRRFAHKGELCLALLDENFRHFQNQQLATMRSTTTHGAAIHGAATHGVHAAYPQQPPSIAQLTAFLHAFIDYTITNLPYLCEVTRSPLGQQGAFDRPHEWVYLTVTGLLRRACSTGEISSSTDWAYWAFVLLAPLEADNLQVQLQQLGFDADRIKRGYAALLHGLSR